MIKIQQIVGEINKVNRNMVFPSTAVKWEGAEAFLNSMQPPVEFLDHGGRCLVFADRKGSPGSDDFVYKLVRVTPETVQSYADFKRHADRLARHGIPIAGPESLFYEDAAQGLFMYKQRRCKTLKYQPLAVMAILVEVMSIVIRHNLPLADLFYRNFGWLDGKVVLFDFHDASVCRSWLFETVKRSFDEAKIADTLGFVSTSVLELGQEEVQQDNVSKQSTVSFPAANVPAAGMSLCSYQKLRVNANTGELEFDSHTKLKSDLAKANLRDGDSVLDMGCNIGGVGFSLLMTGKPQSVTLCEMNETDLASAKSLHQRFNLARLERSPTKFIRADVLHHLATTDGSYDLVLSFSLFHHLLSHQPLNELLLLIKKRCRRDLVVEVPLFGDVLLQNVMSKSPHPSRFNCLASPEAFGAAVHAAVPSCTILSFAQVAYDPVAFKGLLRFVFVCRFSS